MWSCRGVNAVLSQYIGHRAAGDFVTEVRERALKPHVPFSVAIRTISTEISGTIRGLPGPRLSTWFHFIAMSLRCQAISVSGVTIAAMSLRTLRSTRLAFSAKRRRCASVKRRRWSPSISCSTILFFEILNDVELLAMDPAREHDEQIL